VLSPAEVDKLFATCNPQTDTGRRDFAIMLLLFSTGLRASELLNMQVADVDWAQGLSWCGETKAKNSVLCRLAPQWNVHVIAIWMGAQLNHCF